MGVVKPAPRMKGRTLVLDREIERVDRTLGEPRSRLVASGKGGGVTGVEEDLALETARLTDKIHILALVEGLEGGAVRHPHRVGPAEGWVVGRRNARAEETGREPPAAFGERMEGAEVVVEEPVRPDGVGARGRQRSHPRAGSEFDFELANREVGVPGRSEAEHLLVDRRSREISHRGPRRARPPPL